MPNDDEFLGPMNQESDSPLKNWALRVPIYIAGIVVSGFIGVWISAHADRARLKIEIATIALHTPDKEQLLANDWDQAMHGTKTQSFRVNETLDKMLQEHTWLPSPNGDSLNEYISSLLAIQARASETKRLMSTCRPEMAHWPMTYEGAQLDTVYIILRSNSEFVNSQFFGELRRGADVFRPAKPNLDGLSQRYKINTDSDGDFYVDRGVLRIPFLWAEQSKELSSEEKERMESAALRFATALAYGVRNDLEDMKAVINRAFEEEGSVDEAARIASEELKSFSRWRVTAIIANDGHDSVALAPRAMLYLKTKDLVYLNSEHKQERMDSDQRVPLVLITETKEHIDSKSVSEIAVARAADIPVVIKGGEALKVVFQSTSMVSEMLDGEKILSLFDGDGAQCVLAVLPLTDSQHGIGEKGVELSELGLFRDVRFDTVFKENITHWPAEK